MASKGTPFFTANFGGCLPGRSRFELRGRCDNSFPSFKGCRGSGEAIGMTWISELFLSFFCSTWVSLKAGTFRSPFSRPFSSLPIVVMFVLSSLRDNASDTPELGRVTADWVVERPEPRLTKDGESWPTAFFFMLPSLAGSIREEPEKFIYNSIKKNELRSRRKELKISISTIDTNWLVYLCSLSPVSDSNSIWKACLTIRGVWDMARKIPCLCCNSIEVGAILIGCA